MRVASPHETTGAPTDANDVQLKLAICICTRDRPRELRRALESLGRSRVPPAEVIVSDDGHHPAATADVAQGFPGTSLIRGPGRGLGRNRNTAATAVSSPYLLFLDDDAELGPGFIEAAQECLSRQPRARREHSIVTGYEQRAGELVLPHEQDFLGYQRRPYADGEPLQTVVINSTVFPRSLFDRIRFDPRLMYGYDEVDLSSRAVRAGYTIIGCSAAINEHHPSPINRAGDQRRVDEARLYVTAKRRLLVERRLVSGLVFLAVAPAHMILANLIRDGGAGALRAARATVVGLRMLVGHARASTRADRPR